MTPAQSRLLGVSLFVAVCAGDAVTKLLAEAHLPGRPIQLIEDFASFRLAYNRGVAFSALEGLPHWVLGVAALLLLAGVVVGLRKLAARPLGAMALGLVAAGGLCNAIDRLHDGRVTDMISVWRWPVFNVADIGVTVGVALLLIAQRGAPKPLVQEASPT